MQQLVFRCKSLPSHVELKSFVKVRNMGISQLEAAFGNVDMPLPSSTKQQRFTFFDVVECRLQIRLLVARLFAEIPQSKYYDVSKNA